MLALNVCFVGFYCFPCVHASAYVLMSAGVEKTVVHGRAKTSSPPISFLTSWKASEACSWGFSIQPVIQASHWGVDLCSEVAGQSLPLQMTRLCLHGVVQAHREKMRGRCWFCLSRQKAFYLVFLVLNLKIFYLREILFYQGVLSFSLEPPPKKRCTQRG